METNYKQGDIVKWTVDNRKYSICHTTIEKDKWVCEALDGTHGWPRDNSVNKDYISIGTNRYYYITTEKMILEQPFIEYHTYQVY